jgi:hypothetical protein
MPRKRKGGDSQLPSDGKLETSEPSQPQPKAAAEGDRPELTDLVLLVHAANLTEADLYKTELEARGIPAVLEGEGPNLAGIGAGVPVLVPEEFADQAAEFIAELESAKPEGRVVDDKSDLFEEDGDEGLDELDELDSLDDDPEEEEDLEDEDDVDEDDDWDDEDEDEESEDEEDDEEDDEDWDDDDDDEDWEDDDDA